MKTKSWSETKVVFSEADSYELVTSSGRIIVYGEHTDKAARNLRFWLCLQTRNTERRVWDVAGQRYLEKDGGWYEPRGAKYRRNFSSPRAAISHALKINLAGV